MGQDFIAAKFSDDEIRRIAKRTLAFYKPRPAYPIRIVDIVQSGSVLTLKREMPLRYAVAPDHSLDDHAITEFQDDLRIITVRKSINDAAKYGDGHARMTLAHELGHAVMHSGAPKARSIIEVKRNFIKPYESAERQANVFASSFLIDDFRAGQLASPEEISEEFLVSLEAARICFERLHQKARREKISQEMKALAAELASGNKPEKAAPHYLETACPRCSKQ
ncbi:MAG: ImmA/IrrE family metallo-endopeptidase, partial [Methylocystis sp.]